MRDRNLVFGGVFRNNAACPAFVPRGSAYTPTQKTCEQCAWRWDIFCRRVCWGWAAIPNSALNPPDTTGPEPDTYEDP
jgi:hypothetical protein